MQWQNPVHCRRPKANSKKRTRAQTRHRFRGFEKVGLHQVQMHLAFEAVGCCSDDVLRFDESFWPRFVTLSSCSPQMPVPLAHHRLRSTLMPMESVVVPQSWFEDTGSLVTLVCLCFRSSLPGWYVLSLAGWDDCYGWNRLVRRVNRSKVF